MFAAGLLAGRTIIVDIDGWRSGGPGAMMVRAEEGRQMDFPESRIASYPNKLEHAAALWINMPDGMPDGNAVCQLIEAIAMED